MYRASKRELLARAERKFPGCEACCALVSIGRRCMSPGCEGPTLQEKLFERLVHPREIGEEGIEYCKKCRGMDINVRHELDKATLPSDSLHAL